MATYKMAMYYHMQMFLCGGKTSGQSKCFILVLMSQICITTSTLRILQPSPLYKIQNGGNITPSMGQRSIKRLEDKLKAWRRSLCVKYISLKVTISYFPSNKHEIMTKNEKNSFMWWTVNERVTLSGLRSRGFILYWFQAD